MVHQNTRAAAGFSSKVFSKAARAASLLFLAASLTGCNEDGNSAANGQTNSVPKKPVPEPETAEIVRDYRYKETVSQLKLAETAAEQVRNEIRRTYGELSVRNPDMTELQLTKLQLHIKEISSRVHDAAAIKERVAQIQLTSTNSYQEK